MPFPDALEAQSSGGAFDFVDIDDFLEVPVSRVAGGSVGEGGDFCVTEPRNGGYKDDAVNHSALYVFDQTISDYYKPNQSEPKRRALHTAIQAEDIAGDSAAGN
ncbi:unnamed protein product [Cuscuta epithymum]|uniref:Uncharacterized protein n=1 Tax=Cuscuta epithymum TaxID=186058 RepID=A0AAV0ECD5_9ASTE|nr:unnamed protein product [Cuscuta epithymum]